MNPASFHLIDGVLMVAAYLLGAVPFGLLIARANGIDIRQHGSGNIGATNVMRVLGRKAGFTTFALDALKGWIPAGGFPLLAQRLDYAGMEPMALGISCGVASVLGHSFPVYLRFKGGKGVATGAGVLLGIAPFAAVIGLASWGIAFKVTRYVSLASILAAIIVAGVGWWHYGQESLLLPSVLSVIVFLVIIRHRSNILRLLGGNEKRFDNRPPPPPGGGV
jgi:acyl phosphate:glycerol-3-phosphate acyltransferase